MSDESGATVSVWNDTVELPRYSALARDLRTEVCVIGAGVSGLTTAYLLTKAGKRVTVIDAGDIGSGETSRTTAHLTAALDHGYVTIAKLHGEDHARTAAESQMAAIQRIEAIIAREQIACDFERVGGYLFPIDPVSVEERDALCAELEATHAVGLTATTLTADVPMHVASGGTALHYPGQAQFHPLKYLNGLARAITRDGGHIFCGTRAVHIDGDEPLLVLTEEGCCIVANDVVVATNAPINESVTLSSKQAPYRSYVVGFRVPSGSVPRVLMWDTGDPYHYVRVQGDPDGSGHDVLLVGGRDHKAGQADDTDERFVQLEGWGRARFPMAGEIVYRWSGQVLRSHDALPYLGRDDGDSDHRYVITGDCCNGITNGTIGAVIVSDLIRDIPNAWTACYDPRRRRAHALPTYAAENLNVAEQYASWLTPGTVDGVAQIAPGSGAVVRRGLHKVAAYRAPDGTLTECSAVCPHLHCIVHWNETEKSWDCPCHGSRFDAYGHVMNGPAVRDLERWGSDDSSS